MPSTSQSQITVIETTLAIQQNMLSIQLYYPKNKISFPALQNPKRQVSRHRSFQDLLPFPRKSNADKIQKYLERCFHHPIISASSILRDFTRVQRDEDAILESQKTFHTLTPSCDHFVTAPLDLMKDIPPLPTTLDDFDLIKVLGKGCIGKVLLVKSKRDQQLYALKAIQKNWVLKQKEFIHTKAERDILIRQRYQPFLIHLHHVFQTPSTLFLLLDYHPGGDIATRLCAISRFTSEQTRFYAAEIIQGLSVLHKQGIVYRDLKPENVLISRDGHVVLTDFGLSKMFTKEDMDENDVPLTSTFCGTAEYLAPEILLGEPYTFTPFWAETHMDMYRRVIEDPLDFPPSWDYDTCSFLSGLLEKEASERLGWGEDGIDDIKAHSYFDTVDWNFVIERRLRPPYVPVIKDETDISHFDDMFTSMPVRISQSSAMQEQDPFESFDFDSLLIEFQRQNKPRKRPSASCPLACLNSEPANKKQVTYHQGSAPVQAKHTTKLMNQAMYSATFNSSHSVYSALTVENNQQVTSSLVGHYYSSS
ncbi:hypothetical protein G6F24_006727 [Rhizopus arrhizus]|nr:hypothetical protein G6F24_006727 [Rhizopus arrhizus]